MEREPEAIIGLPAGLDNYLDTYPMPRYPNGWYGLLPSARLPPGKLVNLQYFGRELIAFRDSDGRAAVVDAYCPHFGAHLGHSGKVINGEVRCPFHGWQFNGNGVCTAAPYARKIPSSKRSTLQSYSTEEKNGMVLVWFHITGQPPDYFIPQFDSSDAEQWTEADSYRLKFRTHVQELRENFFDETHFVFTHRQMSPAVIDFNTDGPIATHRMPFRYRELESRGLTGARWDFLSDSVLYGPSIINIRLKGLFDVSLAAYSNPIDDLYSEMRVVVNVKKFRRLPGLAALIRRSVVKGGMGQMLHEGKVWSNKRYLEQPMFMAHERATPLFRQWFTQFYDGHEIPPGWYKRYYESIRQPRISAGHRHQDIPLCAIASE